MENLLTEDGISARQSMCLSIPGSVMRSNYPNPMLRADPLEKYLLNSTGSGYNYRGWYED